MTCVVIASVVTPGAWMTNASITNASIITATAVSPADGLVGGLAVVIAFLTLGLSLNLWSLPFEPRITEWVERRFGDRGVRGFWVIVSAAMLLIGSMILSDWRPAYAASTQPQSARDSNP